jgi:hypothetical protein
VQFASTSLRNVAGGVVKAAAKMATKKPICPWFLASELGLLDPSNNNKPFQCRIPAAECNHLALVKMTKGEAMSAVDSCAKVNLERAKVMNAAITRASKATFRK